MIEKYTMEHSDANKRIYFISKFITATDEAKFKRAAWLGIAWVILRMLIVFSYFFRANEIFMVMFVTGVVHVACFTSSPVFLALKTSDIARFPHNDLMKSS